MIIWNFPALGGLEYVSTKECMFNVKISDYSLVEINLPSEVLTFVS